MNKGRKIPLIISLLPGIIGFVIAESIALTNYGNQGESSMPSWNEPIVIALFSLCGTIVGAILTLIWNLIQSRRDSKGTREKIEETKTDIGGVKSDVGSVKADTAAMVPQMSNIEKNTSKIHDKVIEDILPIIPNVKSTADGVQELLKEQEYKKRLQLENLKVSREAFLSEAENIFEENAALHEQYRKDQQEIAALHLQNTQLRKQVEDLTLANQAQKKQIQILDKKRDEPDLAR